jgi:signal peptidase I
MEEYIRRKPLTAFVLSFLTPGLGQLYNGQASKSILLYLLGLLIMVFCSFYGLFFSFNGMIGWLAIVLAYMFFVMIEASISAGRLHTIKAKKYNKWYFYFLIIVINTFLINSLLEPLIIPVKAYKVPVSSMAPTLLIGDHIIVNKRYYADKQPERDDIVIFPSPLDPRKDYIKRVIGLPGETIEIREKKVYINGQSLDEPYVRGTHEAGLSPSPATTENFGPVTVPAGKLFVLGDNRDNSEDSRHFGFVDITSLKGKALYIYWAKDKKRMGSNFN